MNTELFVLLLRTLEKISEQEKTAGVNILVAGIELPARSFGKMNLQNNGLSAVNHF